MWVNQPLNLRHNFTSAGSVLLAVLCLVAVLSFLIITALSVSQQHAGMQEARQGMMRAHQLAEMGVAVAVHPSIKPGDPLLRQQISGIEQFEVMLSTEESRLNLNALLTEEHLPLLERIFTSWGITPGDAQGITAMLMDWTDADDLKRRPDSAEKLDYEQMGLPRLPLNRPFQTLDEVDLLPRMAEILQACPDWQAFFTLRGSGQLDVNMASAEMLAIATGASLTNAELLVQKRLGPDGLPQTMDDVLLTSVEEALMQLGLVGPQAAEVIPLLTLQGQTPRIESIGAAGGARCGLAVTVQKNGATARILEWSEFAVKGESQL
jgi:type II secretory pathway component PulK